MKKITLMAGDIFFTRSENFIGKTIRSVQKFWSKDGKSRYNHCGVIISPKGKTIEALSKGVFHGNIFSDYGKTEIMIARHEHMNMHRFAKSYAVVRKHLGRRYPHHRLLFHMMPVIAKNFNPSKLLVCSEITGKFLMTASLIGYYLGLNVDDLEDMVRTYKWWNVITERGRNGT